MCVWPFVLYVHATNTSNLHAKERRAFEYSDRCCQCGAALTDHTRVAAHMVAYPCFCLNFCLGHLTLKTTCKVCNGANRRGKRVVDSSSWLACSAANEPFAGPQLGWVCLPCCFQYECPNPSR